MDVPVEAAKSDHNTAYVILRCNESTSANCLGFAFTYDEAIRCADEIAKEEYAETWASCGNTAFEKDWHQQCCICNCSTEDCQDPEVHCESFDLPTESVTHENITEITHHNYEVWVEQAKNVTRFW